MGSAIVRFRSQSNNAAAGIWNIGAVPRTSSLVSDFIFQSRTANSTYSELARFSGNGGITFNGDTATANALDDYEEGTFQVTLSSTGGRFVATVGNTTGHYIKIGRQVTCHWYSSTLNISNIGSGTSRINGLPFVAANTGDLYPVARFSHTTAFTTPTNGGYVSFNSSVIVPTVDDSSSQAQWIAGNPRYVMFSASYIAA